MLLRPPESSGSSAESHSADLESITSGRLNWLRAAVLGANDGIVSTAAIVLGFAGATDDRSSILIAGVVGLLAGAMSMSVGEYVSVSTQRASEQSMLDLERRELRDDPEGELAELAEIYRGKGLSAELSQQVARELTAHDALGAHAEAELGLDPDELTNPWHAALASFLAFVCGAIVPLIAVLVGAGPLGIGVSVALAMAATGLISARLGRSAVVPALVRNVGGGLLAMAITYGLGSLVGGAVF